MDAAELEENWQRACRANPLINRFVEPHDAHGLVGHVLARVRGGAQPPNPILAGLAMGFASSDYETLGEARYLQLAMLVTEAAKDPDADPRAALEVLIVLGQATVGVLLDAWRGEAEVDELTRLGNRRKRDASIAAYVAVGQRFAYASIDADGLKQVNDTLGHEAGDDFLRILGEELGRTAQEADGEAFRYAGDEFGIIIPIKEGEPDLAELLVGAEARLSASVTRFSAGSAIWPEDGTLPTAVIALADQRMFVTKAAKKQAAASAANGNDTTTADSDGEAETPESNAPDGAPAQ